MYASNTGKIYFLSDFHLGAPNHKESLIREKRIVDFLQRISADATEIFIVGDIFDFWFEYKRVVPKGFIRLLGTLALLSDRGIKIHFFPGNHDMWVKDYFQKEFSCLVYHQPEEFMLYGKSFLIGHGDGLGPGDHGYKMLKKVFRNPVAQSLFGILPPYIGMTLADFFSRKSREATGKENEAAFMGEENEWLVSYAKEILQTKHYDYFIFGHRHLPIDMSLSPTSRYINLGDWIRYFTYATFDGKVLILKSEFEENENLIIRKP